MPGAWFYDLMYRFGAPWELGVRSQLRTLELPRISFSGPSRLSPSIEPGEMERLFGADWEIEQLTEFESERQEAVFLMRRHQPA